MAYPSSATSKAGGDVYATVSTGFMLGASMFAQVRAPARAAACAMLPRLSSLRCVACRWTRLPLHLCGLFS